MRCISLLSLFFVSLGVFGKPVVLATHNLSPYGSYPVGMPIELVANEQFRGFAVDRVRCAFNKMGQELTVLVVPWARAQRLAESSEVDGFFAGSQNNYRDSYAQRTAVIAEQKWKWYWLKSNPQNVNDLKSGARIGAFIGSNMSRWLEDNGYPIFNRPNTTKQLVLLLKKQRLDIIIANNLVAEKLLNEMEMMEEVDSSIVKDKPLYLFFTKRNLKERPELVAQFNRQLEACYLEETNGAHLLQ
ncbi:ABC transporter substrate-binding protein [uncultured Vibrio sp.]|uniref:substrate-binding periplasmic protein n=1 Tax=uncultured Vibrio sp. TaxID=114054 RepID=UPI0025E69BE6|nr:transporter substrate-binding domain-containing protein [uncultured Vibrio sp.]